MLQYGIMDSSVRIKLGKKIRKYRLELGYTQEKLSETASIDYKYLQRVEGKNPPALKIDTINKLAKAFKITIAELLEF